MDGKINLRIFIEFMIFIKGDSIRIPLTKYKDHLERILKWGRPQRLFGLLANVEVKGRD
jgi:hypothetical protein